MGAFGDKLRKQREQRGIELDAISNTTKISTRMLRAIEDEHFDQLPGGVFNKGFVRAYARHVGLDEEEAVTDYLAALRENQIQSQTVPPNFRAQPGKPATEPPPRNHDPNNFPGADLHENDLHKTDLRKNNRADIARPTELHHNKKPQTLPPRSADRRREDRRRQARNSKNLRPPAPDSPARPPLEGYPEGLVTPPPDDAAAKVPWGKLAVALLALTLLLAFWSYLRRGHTTSVPQPEASSHPAPVPFSPPAQITTHPPDSKPALTAGKALPTGTLAAAQPRSPNPAPTLANPTALKPSPAAPSITLSTSKPAATSLNSDSPNRDNTNSDNPNNDNQGNDNPADDNPPIPKSRAHAPAAIALPTFTLLIRAAETSWISVTADGQPLLRETLIAPAHTSIRATREIIVRTGNAAAISFLLNGKEIPPSGTEGEVMTYTFDNTGLKTSTAAHPPNPAP